MQPRHSCFESYCSHQTFRSGLVEIEIWRTPVLGRLTSSVSVVSDFVANGYQTMQHVSTSPPAIPDGQRPDFPGPVLTLIYLRSSFHSIGSLSADTHTPLYYMVYFQGRFYNLLTSPSCPVTQEAIKCPEPLCTLKVLPLAPKCHALRRQTLLCPHRSYGLMRQS